MPRVHNLRVLRCARCDSEFADRTHDTARPRLRFCSRSCATSHFSVGRKGPTNPPKNRERCVVCSSSFAVAPSAYGHYRHKRTCSPICSRQWKAERQRGERSHRWKGGLTDAATLLRCSLEYAEWRRAVFARDDFTCRMCTRRGGRLAAHHIRPFAQFPELRLVASNGISLCWPCHRSVKGKEAEYEARFLAITEDVARGRHGVAHAEASINPFTP